MSVKPVATSFVEKLQYTNKVLPKIKDSTWKKVAKWALIILSLGSVFVVSLLMDLTKKLFSKLTYKVPVKPVQEEKTKKEKAVYAYQNVRDGFKDGASEILYATKHYSSLDDKYNKWGMTAGYIAGTAALFAIGDKVGLKGWQSAIGIGLFGTALKPLSDKVWQPLNNRYHVTEKVWNPITSKLPSWL